MTSIFVADMKPDEVLEESARVFSPTGVTQNPVSKTWSIEDASQSWPDLTGYFVTWGNPEDFLFGVIHENTGTELVVAEKTSGWFDDPDLTERKLGAGDLRQIHCSASLLIQGIAIQPADPEEGGVTISNSETWMEFCRVERPFFAAPVYRHYTFNCDLIAPAWSGPFYLSGSRVVDFEFEAFEAPVNMIIVGGTVFENIGTITPVNLDPNFRFGANMLMDSVLIKNNIGGDGVFLPGGVGVIRNADINNCDGGNAFHFKGPGKYTLANVAGSDSTGVGVRVDDGAVVETTSKSGQGDELIFFPEEGVVVLNSPGIGLLGASAITIDNAGPGNDGTFSVIDALDDDNIFFFNPDGSDLVAPFDWIVNPVTVTGDAGDQEVGDLGAGVWPSPLPFNIVDLFGGVAPNNTGTGSRLYNK